MDVLILAGPSAVGKTTIATALTARHPFMMLRSATTRKPRSDANDGEYIYLEREQFMQEVAAGGFVEYTEYDQNLYGTPKSELVRAMECGKIPLLVLDLKGVLNVRGNSDSDINAYCVYIYDGIERIKKRLAERYSGRKDADIQYRARVGLLERDYGSAVGFAHTFDTFVENTELDLTVERVLRAFLSRSATPEENIRVAQQLCASVR